VSDETADPLEALVHHMSRLPGIGSKTATRLAHFIVRTEGLAGDLADALAGVREGVGRCSVCFHLASGDPCSICADGGRDDTIVCVVERSQDLEAIERAGTFRGRYHVLEGVLAPLDGIGADDLRIRELIDRVSGVDELILATNPTAQGDVTALYIAQLVSPLGVKVTRIARGVSVGSELEYTDASTITRAIEERRELTPRRG
jgi:recombination protein RecR